MNKKATENSWQQHKQEQIVLGQTACPLNEMTVVRGELPVSFYLGFSEAFDSDIYRICIVKLKRQDGWTAVWVVSSWTAVYEAQESRQPFRRSTSQKCNTGLLQLNIPISDMDARTPRDLRNTSDAALGEMVSVLQSRAAISCSPALGLFSLGSRGLSGASVLSWVHGGTMEKAGASTSWREHWEDKQLQIYAVAIEI